MIASVRRFVRPPLVAGILLLALIAFVSRACDQSRVSVTQAEAVATARTQIDYPPDGHNVRFLRRGLTQHPYWAVSLWTRARTATATSGSPWSWSTRAAARSPRYPVAV